MALDHGEVNDFLERLDLSEIVRDTNINHYLWNPGEHFGFGGDLDRKKSS
jgi:hypothetical protein